MIKLKESVPVSKREFEETKKFLENGGVYENERAGYLIFIAKDGTRYFDYNGKNRFFKNLDAFINATVRTVKTGRYR